MNFKNIIVSAVKVIISGLIEALCAFLNPLLLPIADALPTITWNTSFLSYCNFANYFFDFQYAFSLFVAYLLFALTITIINWILGLIPTIN